MKKGWNRIRHENRKASLKAFKQGCKQLLQEGLCKKEMCKTCTTNRTKTKLKGLIKLGES